jgi:hypothetical protein
MTIYVVTRQSKDVVVSMVEIMGVFRTEGAANRCREDLWERHKVSGLVIQKFLLSDYRYPAPTKAKAEKAEGKR